MNLYGCLGMLNSKIITCFEPELPCPTHRIPGVSLKRQCLCFQPLCHHTLCRCSEQIKDVHYLSPACSRRLPFLGACTIGILSMIQASSDIPLEAQLRHRQTSYFAYSTVHSKIAGYARGLYNFKTDLSMFVCSVLEIMVVMR
jgi:hypothetical protein